MRRRRLAGTAMIIVGIAPLAVIAVTFIVWMNAGPCRRPCSTDYFGIPFMLLAALVWLGVALLVARAVSKRGSRAGPP